MVQFNYYFILLVKSGASCSIEQQQQKTKQIVLCVF